MATKGLPHDILHPGPGLARGAAGQRVSTHLSAPEEQEALGEMVRQKRERYGLSLREAAKTIGVSFSTITRIEHGKPPSFAAFVRIARWLGIEV